jgi:hypothetical protein
MLLLRAGISGTQCAHVPDNRLIATANSPIKTVEPDALPRSARTSSSRLRSGGSMFGPDFGEAEIRRLTPAGERIVWRGRPAQGLRFSPADIAPGAIGIGFIAVGVNVIQSMLQHAASKDPAAQGTLIFLAVWSAIWFGGAGYAAFGHFLADAFERSRTWYALTDASAIIARRVPWRPSSVVRLSAIPTVEFKTTPDGRGTIVFSSGGPERRVAFPVGPPTRPGFYAIEEPDRVYALIAQHRTPAASR